MTFPQFDLAIIGGGPAGTSAAITAARLGARVLLCEARSFPRHKVCGEFVSAESLDILANLLRDFPSAGQMFDAAPRIDRARLLLGTRTVEAGWSPAALSIPRYVLDARLWQAAIAAGAEARTNGEVTSISGNGPFCLQTSMGEITAKTIIVAAGRWSQFTPDRAIPPGPRWIGLKAHFREAHPPRSTDLYFFENGYCGVQPLAADTVNACAMVRSDRATSLSEVFELHAKLRARAAGWTPMMPPVSTAPLIYRQAQPTRRNLLFAGDAAAFIDPFVGDGISIALRTGQAAARSLTHFVRGETTLPEAVASYRREYTNNFAPLLMAASRVRALLSLREPARTLAFELLRFPGLMPLVMRKTRRAR